MNMTISGHHLTVSDALRTHVMARLQPIARHFDHLIDASVVLRVDAAQPSCPNNVEATLHIPGHDLHAQACGDNMYVAIDQLMLKLDRQVIKHKSKMQAHRGVRVGEVEAVLESREDALEAVDAETV